MDKHGEKRLLATAQREEPETKRKALSEEALAAKAKKEEKLAAADNEKQAISHSESRLSATQTLPFEEYWRMFHEKYEAYLWRVAKFTGDDWGLWLAITESQEEAFKDRWIQRGVKCGRCNNNLCACDPRSLNDDEHQVFYEPVRTDTKLAQRVLGNLRT